MNAQDALPIRADAEVDAIMATVYPGSRAWCVRSGPIPGSPPCDIGCACMGCLSGEVTYPEFKAWQLRELSRPPTPWIDPDPWVETVEPKPLSLHERLAVYKQRKQVAP